ncbi:MAG: 30S ribosomal protein S2 [Planctomycetes bacterium]|nr:30S ribosomal protein S2 [Planctomycetota bacterium]
MALISLTDLVEGGAHFGHRSSRWNPKMKPYIMGTRKGSHIIDLKETIKGVIKATELLKAIAKRGGMAIFVGTKKQLASIIESEAKRCNMPYVNNRWLGGTLTNFDTIKKQLTKFLKFEKSEAEGTIVHYNKKEQSQFQRELERLRGNLGGLREMSRVPDVLIAVDQSRSKTSLDEAIRSNIPTICLLDTDGNPSDITIPIPINDDAIKSVGLVLTKLADAIIEGKSELVIKPLKTEAEPEEKATKRIIHFKKEGIRPLDKGKKDTKPRVHTKK